MQPNTGFNRKFDGDAVDPTGVVPSLLLNSNTGSAYRRDRLLGRGNFGKCFAVTKLKNGSDEENDGTTTYACKTLSKTFPCLQDELNLHRLAGKHPNIVHLFETFDDANHAYLIMEICPNGTLADVLERRGNLSLPEVRYFLRQICQAVGYLHDNKRIIHRDLKPANFMLTATMELKLGDFGLATKVEYDGEVKRSVCGTLAFMAPEMLTKEGYSFPVDLWSIGCLVYSLLYGQSPFLASKNDLHAGNTQVQIMNRIMLCQFALPTDRQDVASLLLALLNRNPAQRPSCSEILQSSFLSNGLVPESLPVEALFEVPLCCEVGEEDGQSSTVDDQDLAAAMYGPSSDDDSLLFSFY